MKNQSEKNSKPSSIEGLRVMTKIVNIVYQQLQARIFISQQSSESLLFYNAKRISITREKRDSWGLEINPRKGKNWSLKLSSKQSSIKDDNSPKESEYSTKSTFNKDQGSEFDQQRFRNSDKKWILKLHLNKWSPEMNAIWRIS